MMSSSYRLISPPGMSLLVLGLAVGCLTSPARAAEPPPRGALIYKNLCAQCHGDRGQGVVDKYDEPLHGSRTVDSLAKRIAKTMPEDNVGACVGDDAKAVAEYIYDAFYSPQAQLRLRPPEFDVARLTNAQFRNSVTDLVSLFRPGAERPGERRGLNARYSGKALLAGEPPPPEKDPKKRREQEERERVEFDRIDERIGFSYGAASPEPQRMRADEFKVRWEGAILAPQTGSYEFVLRTENGARLWVNDRNNMLIDAWVSQGPKVRSDRQGIHLLAGRLYPVIVEFFKAPGEKSASIELRWKPPHGVEDVIPSSQLLPQSAPTKFVASTSFPADDRSAGYERGTTVSKGWDQATTDAAIETAEYVVDHLDRLAGAAPGASDRAEKLKAFARRFVEGAFRRPLSPEEVRRYVDAQFTAAKTPELAVKRVVLLALKSPRFLFPELPGQGTPDGYDVATRLALYLWDSIPDKALLDAAAAGKLGTRGQVAAQAERMLADPRAKTKLHGFFHHWLELERGESISKDPKAFPEFTGALLSDLRTSLDLFLDDVVWGEKSDYRELLYADYLYLNERLGKLYGKSVSGETFRRVPFDPKQRAGVVTHPYLLAAFAYSKQTSPIHRGVFLTRSIVGMTLKPPPDAVAFDDAMFDQHLTMREKITELTKSTNCMGCHATINPLGFSLENYDAIGRWRTKERDKAIDAVTDFATDEGQTIRLTGPRDLVKFAAESPNGHRAFIHQLFHHTVKQEVGVYGPDTLEALRQSFAASHLHVRKLLTEIATIAASRGLPDAAPRLPNQQAAAAAP
jgi:hypothetical protein